jgi:uncharacterized protein (DUF433 family)
MEERKLSGRVTFNRKVMLGKPAIKGTRLTVEHILRLSVYVATVGDVLKGYQGLRPEDIRACILFAVDE